ncbi:gluconate:H+ symporter [uncultured Jatrophihabitans sp.]|uniref:GntT/GntP/DsdX family permease n=1 Tax=uncultured Jatrophihabitans sp. TaxID=1610747 RepID=UPI0035CA9E26
MTHLSVGPASVVAAKATSSAWHVHDTRLILVAVVGIALIVVLIAALDLHPFLALILGSAFVGIASGIDVQDVIKNFETGVGATLMEVGLLIALGAMLGKLLAESGGADRVVDTLVRRAGPRMLPWAMGLVALIVGLPMFFEIGLVLLLPVIVLVTKKSELPLMRIAIPALAGLSVLHGLIPPHPGPLVAISQIHADLGITLALGVVVAIPTAIICGPLFSILAAKWVPVGPPAQAGGVVTEREGTGVAADDVTRPPSFAVTLATILFPVVLMLLKALADVVWDDSMPTARKIADFIGEPLVALTLAVLLASVTFGYAVGFSGKAISKRLGDSLGPIAAILLIVGAGGGFKQTLVGAGVGDSIGKAAHNSGVPLLVVGWLLAVAIRLATGSATVATTTAAGIVGPLAGSLGSAHLALLALAVGCGSLFLSHVNDAGFWLVNQSFGLTVGQTFKTWSVMETLVSTVGFGFVSILWAVT